MRRESRESTYETRCCLLIGSDIVRARVEWIVLDLDLLWLVLSGTSSKNEMSCMTCPEGESMECLLVRRGETVTARVDFSMVQIGKKYFSIGSSYW
jgi:hypothetical protein